MNLQTSLYLDLVRFSAAFLVFLGHYSSRRLSGGVFWQVAPYGHLAVIVFFVLSGLVIAYATERKDNTLRAYSLSRLSRLYSVVAPAIAITLIADAIGTRVAPELYSSDWGYADSNPILRTLAALTFTTHIWFLNIQPFSDGPFWSLPYEFWYYVLFGVIVFAEGPARWLRAAAVVLIAGPRILFLLPVWLMGVFAYRVMATARLSVALGWVLFLGSTLGIALLLSTDSAALNAHLPDAVMPERWKPYCCSDTWAPYGTIYDLMYGVLFTANFIGFRFAGAAFLPLLKRLQQPIRWLAGFSFSLYLFHMPLLQLFAAISPWGIETPLHQTYLLIASLGTTIALSRVTEHRRGDLRKFLARLIPEQRMRAQLAQRL